MLPGYLKLKSWFALISQRPVHLKQAGYFVSYDHEGEEEKMEVEKRRAFKAEQVNVAVVTQEWWIWTLKAHTISPKMNDNEISIYYDDWDQAVENELVDNFLLQR